MIIDDLNRIKAYLEEVGSQKEYGEDPEGAACLALLENAIPEVIALKQAILDNMSQREGYKYLIRELEDKLGILKK